MEILKENGNLLGSSSVAAAKNGLTDTNRLPQSSMDGKNKNSFQLDSRDPNNQLPSLDPYNRGVPSNATYHVVIRCVYPAPRRSTRFVKDIV